VTVIDTSGVVDFLLGIGAAPQVEAMMTAEGELAAPDLIVFEVLAVLRRETLNRALDPARASAAVSDLGDLQLALFPTLPLRTRAWELRRNATTADAIFVALAEHLGEPLATKDGSLARAAAAHANVEVVRLPSTP
jgi:predicted nucleic acid-binding protein